MAAMFEFMVDRAKGRIHDGQWIQNSPKSIVITGLYTHVLPLCSIYTKPFYGWFTVHRSAFEKGKSAKLRLPQVTDDAPRHSEEQPQDDDFEPEPDTGTDDNEDE